MIYAYLEDCTEERVNQLPIARDEFQEITEEEARQMELSFD